MSLRSLRHPDDVAGLTKLFERCRNHDGRLPLSEHKYRSVSGRHLRGEGLVVEQDGVAIAYLHLLESKRKGTFEMELAVDPAERGEVEERLLRAGLARVGDLGGRAAYLWVYTPGGADRLAKLGFTPARDLHQLRISLPAGPPRHLPRTEIRPFAVGDESALLHLNNRAFEGHPEAGNWSVSDVYERQDYEWYDPAGLRMLWLDNHLVAFCWTKMHPDGIGEIYLIATDPDHRGRGLGRATTLEGLRFLHEEQGATTGMLYVDGSNEQALRLYDQLGFEIHHTDRAFIARL